MPAQLVVLAPHDSLDVLIHILTHHPRFDSQSLAVMLDCDGTISCLDDPSGTTTLRGGVNSLRFFHWLTMCRIPYFVVSARSTNAQTTLEVASTVVTLQIPRPLELEDHMREAFALRAAEQVLWYPDGPLAPPHIGLAAGNVVSSVQCLGVSAALPKTYSVEFAVEHFLDNDPSMLCFVDDVFDNVADMYKDYMDDRDTFCLCVYYPRPIALQTSELEAMRELLHVVLTPTTAERQHADDVNILTRLLREAETVAAAVAAARASEALQTVTLTTAGQSAAPLALYGAHHSNPPLSASFHAPMQQMQSPWHPAYGAGAWRT